MRLLAVPLVLVLLAGLALMLWPGEEAAPDPAAGPAAAWPAEPEPARPAPPSGPAPEVEAPARSEESVSPGGRLVEPAWVVSGRLLTEEGRPAAGATVLLPLRRTAPPGAQTARARTGADGRFRLRWTALHQQPELRLEVLGDDLQLARLRAPASGPRLDLGDLALPAERSLDAVLLGPDGEPLAGAEVGVRDPVFTPFGRTDAEGRFRWTSRSRLRVLGVRHEGLLYWFGVPLGRPVQEFRLAGVSWDRYPVVDPAGLPLEGAWVRWQSKLGPNLTVEGTGRAAGDPPEIEVARPLERYRPRFFYRWREDEAWTARGLRRLTRPGLHDVLELTPPRTLEARVRAAGGEVLEEGILFHLLVRRPVGEAGSPWVWRPAPAEPLGQGWYRLEGLSPGALVLAAEAPGFLRRARPPEDAAGSSPLLEFELHPPAEGEILLRDADDRPVSGVTVRLVCDGDLEGAGGLRCSSGLGDRRYEPDLQGRIAFPACWHRITASLTWQGRRIQETWTRGQPPLRIVLPSPEATAD